MTKTISKPVFAGLFAAVFAVLMALAFAPSAYADDLAAADLGAQEGEEDVAFMVFKQVATGYDADGNLQYGDATLAKTYTESELKAIAVNKDAADAPGYNKYAKNFFAYAVTSYVELAQFAKDAGVSKAGDVALMRFVTGSFSYDAWQQDPSALKDALWHKAPQGSTEEWSGITGKELAGNLMFYPSQRTDSGDPAVDFSTEGATKVPAVLALAYGRQAISDGMTASDARDAAAAASKEDAWAPLFGTTTDYFAANGPQMGNTMPTGVKGVLVMENPIKAATVAKIPAYTYTGKSLRPAVKVTFGGKTLVKGTDYSVSYKNNIKAGVATAVITGKGDFSGSVNKTFTIKKAAQTIKASNFAKALKANKKGVLAKAATFNVKKLAKVTAPAKAQYAKASKAGGAKIAVSKAGVITAKKGLKKGKYAVKVKITAAADANHNAAKAKTITATITVK